MPKVIDRFENDYSFLSNFYVWPVEYEGKIYQNAEAAFQAAKVPNEQRWPFTEMTPSEARRAGKLLKIDVDEWNAKRISVMEEVLRKKFAVEFLRCWLINTGQSELIEGNWWHDKFWGVCGGTGENNLGKLLMKLRQEYINKTH
jgi:ribA/ribD-fused uncharacterized protein